MAVLGATNLTGCNSIPDFIPTGTRAMFVQAGAPTSWTRVTDDGADNRMLRVVSGGGGGGIGGSASPILNNVVPSHTHSFSTGNQSANHIHGFSTGNVSSDHQHYYISSQLGACRNDSPRDDYLYQQGQFTGGITANHFHSGATDGNNASHFHSGTTDNGSSQTNWSPRYINMILCSKN
jgi:hypothetical protein